jgi:alpha-glucosidase
LFFLLQIGNHDQHRVATRFGPELVDGLNALALLLPGAAVTYNGEEIGMVDTPISFHDTVDPAGIKAGPLRYELFSRDPERTPFQWDDSINAGSHLLVSWR